MSHILLADEDTEQRAFLDTELSARGYSVEAVPHGDQALQMLLAKQPDLAVIASKLPLLNANQICHALRKAGHTTPVVQLLPENRSEARVTALQAGADYALACPVQLDELLASMQALLRRSLRADANSSLPLSHRDLVVHLQHPIAERNGRDLMLTGKEYELLLCLMRNRGNVCSRAQILADVWGRSWESTNNLLDVYIGYLRKKLDQAPEKPMLRTIRGVGFILD